MMKRHNILMKTTLGATALIGLSVAGAVAHGVPHAPFQHELRIAAPTVEVIEGVIERVDLNAKKFDVALKEEGLRQDTRKKVTLTCNDQTVFTLDGVSSTMGEVLKEKRETVVTHEEHVAARVDVWSEPEN